MSEMFINNWGGGIGDDPFLNRTGECLDMDGIDIRTTPRKIQCAESFLGLYATETAPYNDTLNYAYESIVGVVQCYESHLYVGATNLDSIASGADRSITIGSNLSEYNASTNPEGVRHIVFEYNNSTNPITVIKNVAGTATLHSTINTSGGASPANIPASLKTTAVCELWNGVTLFARGSKIYEVLLEPTTPVLSTGAKISLQVGAVVKNIYYYGGMIQIVYTIGDDTYIQGCQYNGTTYTLNTYNDHTPGEKCIDTTLSNGIISWISPNGIFEFSGASQMVRKYTFTTSAKCAYNKGILRIGDGTNFYEYGVQKPGYGKPFTKISTTLDIRGVTRNNVITFQSGVSKFRLDSNVGAYKATNYYITHPYTAGQYGLKKKGLGFKIGYTLPRGTYTDSSIQCSITVQIQTDDIYLNNTTTFVTVDTITDNTKTSHEIMMTTINKALETAGYSSDFGYVRLKLILNAGDPYSAYGNTLLRKTPEVYDVYLTHEVISNSFR